jgi:PPP family 3-phenylpropionic acid transporter
MASESRIGVRTQSAARRFSIGVAVFFAAMTGLIGTYLPFFPVWLKAIGIESWWIGWITAVPACTRFTVLPFITGFAERRGGLRIAIIAASFATVCGFIAVGLVQAPVAILIAFALTSCVWTPLYPMSDGYALKGVIRYGLDYGPLRLWGSVAFVVGALVCGALVYVVPGPHLIWVIVASGVVMCIASLGLMPIEERPSGARPVRPARWLLRQRPFLAIVAAAALVQGSHAAYYAFASITWQTAGLGGLTIAMLWSLGVLAEIVVFALSPRYGGSPVWLVIAGASGAVVRWIITAYEPPIAILAAVQLMHGMSFGMTHLGTVGLMVRVVPHTIIASGQGYQVAAIGIVTSLAMIGTGALYGAIGLKVYDVMAAMAFVALILMVTMRKQIERAPQPHNAASGGETVLPS